MNVKLSLFVIVILLLTGCITKEDDYMEKISVLAEGFNEGDTIPDEFTCNGKNISPSISWKGIPAGTESITLIMDDPDAPRGTFVHWVIYNMPARTRDLPKGMPNNKTLADGSMQGMTDFGRPGYGGPCPPPGKPHRYFFKVYALDMKINLPAGASKSQVESAMKGHILAEGVLMGKYQR